MPAHSEIIQPVIHIGEVPTTESILASIPAYSPEEKRALIAEIKAELKRQDAVLVAHYYTDAELQEIAEETGGYVSDSLDMAKFGNEHSASTLVVAGVRFMGETAKILTPEKRILMPELAAECSLDLGCPATEFAEFCDQHPDRVVVVYANTSAEVKARADYVVTSSIAVKLIQHLHNEGKKVLWAPDHHLGSYIKRITKADMLLWNATCIVHDEFKFRALGRMIEHHPDAAVLVHPESPAEVIDMADVVGSTTQLINAAKSLPQSKLIVATDKGIFHKMRKAAPDKDFLEAPTGGIGATCRSCAHCPWMAMNSLDSLLKVLKTGTNEIKINEDIRTKALHSTQRMLDFAKDLNTAVLGQGNT